MHRRLYEFSLPLSDVFAHACIMQAEMERDVGKRENYPILTTHVEERRDYERMKFSTIS